MEIYFSNVFFYLNVAVNVFLKTQLEYDKDLELNITKHESVKVYSTYIVTFTNIMLVNITTSYNRRKETASSWPRVLTSYMVKIKIHLFQIYRNCMSEFASCFYEEFKNEILGDIFSFRNIYEHFALYDKKWFQMSLFRCKRRNWILLSNHETLQ